MCVCAYIYIYTYLCIYSTKQNDQEHRRRGKRYLWRVHGKGNQNSLSILKMILFKRNKN